MNYANCLKFHRLNRCPVIKMLIITWSLHTVHQTWTAGRTVKYGQFRTQGFSFNTIFQKCTDFCRNGFLWIVDYASTGKQVCSITDAVPCVRGYHKSRGFCLPCPLHCFAPPSLPLPSSGRQHPARYTVLPDWRPASASAAPWCVVPTLTC